MTLAAFERGCPEIHHSDQGMQYAATADVDIPEAREVKISVASVGEPEENDYAERLMRTLEEEEVDLSEYEDFGAAIRAWDGSWTTSVAFGYLAWYLFTNRMPALVPPAFSQDLRAPARRIRTRFNRRAAPHEAKISLGRRLSPKSDARTLPARDRDGSPFPRLVTNEDNVKLPGTPTKRVCPLLPHYIN